MEEKLRAWLESKGKTKSVQRIGAYGSPFLASSVKKPDYHGSAKAKVNTNRGASNAKERYRLLFERLKGLTEFFSPCWLLIILFV